jgi:hypothetical protein
MTLLSIAAVAQSQLPSCKAGATKHDCFGTYTASNGGIYVGEFKDGKRHGKGTHKYGAGGQYEGEFRDDKRNGQGTHNYLNGNKYVGEFKDDKRHGLGSFYHLADNQWKGDKFVGNYKDDLPNGHGTYIRISGEIHEGEYKNNKLNGQGILIFANGNKYVGEFKEGKRNGQGTLTYANGDKYVGDWKDDWGNGKGTKTFVNGDIYVGQFKDGKRNGQGTLTYANGKKHFGEFKDGEPNGEGIEFSSAGSINRQGIWANGNLVQSLVIDAQRIPFSASAMAPVSQAQNTDPDKVQRDRLLAELEVSRKKQQELEDRLAVTQAQPNKSQLSLPKPVGATFRSAHALVIGNAAYAGSNRLDNTINDANAISQKLRSMGFTVTTVTDANRLRLVQAMAQFKRSAASADLSLLFYAGHGVQIFGTNYILPTDVDQSDVAQATIQGVSLNSVVENFLPGKAKLVFLDACRDNPLQRSGDRSVSKGLAPISVAQGTLISYATKDGQTASDGVGAKNSPFTQALIQHLDDPADIAVVLRKVREKVMQATGGKQQPWEYGSLTGGELVLSAIKQK